MASRLIPLSRQELLTIGSEVFIRQKRDAFTNFLESSCVIAQVTSLSFLFLSFPNDEYERITEYDRRAYFRGGIRPRPREIPIGIGIVYRVRHSKRDLVRPNYTPCEDEINKVLKHLHKSAVTFFLALCNTGARVNELRTANVSDFDHDLGTIRINQKRGQRRRTGFE
jgi:integrase